ncbi:MAG: hypothetical protein RIA69_07205 [Cyclobacteriaceae bacterium]
MRKFTVLTVLFSLIHGLAITSAYAQDNEFVFIAADLEPQSDGFYVKGLTFKWDGSPIEFFANGCPGEEINGRVVDPEDYERRDPFNVTFELHRESGEAQGFTFNNTMILPDCNHKFYDDEEIIDPPVTNGFIQLHPSVDANKDDIADEDSIFISYVSSPLLSNLTSITVETSADVGPNGNRNIPYYIEASLDSGKTWDETTYFIEGLVSVRSGTRSTYVGEDLWGMDELSNEQNIKVRLRTYNTDQERPNSGQYVNLHKFTVVADSAKATDPIGGGGEEEEEEEEEVLGLKSLEKHIKIDNYNISSLNGDITVYSISGKIYGKGESVKVSSGIYIITTESGYRRKVFIK